MVNSETFDRFFRTNLNAICAEGVTGNPTEVQRTAAHYANLLRDGLRFGDYSWQDFCDEIAPLREDAKSFKRDEYEGAFQILLNGKRDAHEGCKAVRQHTRITRGRCGGWGA